MTILLDDVLKSLKETHGIESQIIVSKSVMFTTMLDFDRKYLRRCETFIKQNGNVLKNKTNLQSPMTDWEYILTEKHFHPLVNAICGTMAKIINREALSQLDLVGCWGAYYNKDDHALRHDHKESEWSFVYYVNAESGSSTFDIHQDFEPFRPDKSISIEAKTNKLIIFRGHTQHSVSPQKGDGPRVVIAGNFMVRKPDGWGVED